MNLLRTQNLTILETMHTRRIFRDTTRCAAFVAWSSDDPGPTLLCASGLLAETSSGWVLCHVLVADEARGRGCATEIVRFYEERLGTLGACWATTAGAAFGHRYIQRFGPRPHWEFNPPVGWDKAIEDVADRDLANRQNKALVDAAIAGRVAL